MKKIIATAAICLTLSTFCFAGENIEPDIEMGISSIKITSSAISPSIAEDEKQEEQISQRLPMTIHDVGDIQRNDRREQIDALENVNNATRNWTKKFINLITSNTREIVIGVAIFLIGGEIYHLSHS